VKRGDQNFAAIGPARLSSEEETQQQIDKGIPPANIVNIDLGEIGQTVSSYGEFYPGYYYSQQHIALGVSNSTALNFYLNALFIAKQCTLAELAIRLVNAADSSYVGASQVQFQMAIYTSLYGLPYAKIYEGQVFDMATLTTLSYMRDTPNIVLPPGKYFVGAATGGGTPLSGPLQTPILRYRSMANSLIHNWGFLDKAATNPGSGAGSTDLATSLFTNATLPSPYTAGSLPDIIDFSDSAVMAASSNVGAFPDIYMKFA
jgi:hypothetical protein